LSNFFGTASQSWIWEYFVSNFGWVDWMLLTFVFLGVLLGLKNGLSVELPRLGETLLSLYLTMEFHTFFAAWVARETPWPETHAKIFTFFLTWCLSWFVLRLLFEIAGRLVHLEVAGPFQWVAGLFVGGLRYTLLCSVVSFFLVLFPLDWIQQSYKVQSWSGQTLAQVPAKIHSWINEFILQRESAQA